MKNLLLIVITIIFNFGITTLALNNDRESLIPSVKITSSAIDAAKKALEVVSENIANQYTTSDSDGKPYKAKTISFVSIAIDKQGGKSLEGVAHNVGKNKSPGLKTFNPGHPHADQDGYVESSNVKIAEEMVNMMKYSRWMEAQYAVANTSIKMAENALLLGR